MSRASAEVSEYDRLGVRPTREDGARLGAGAPGQQTTRPHRPPSGAEVTGSETGRLVGRHLTEVPDLVRREPGEVRELLARVQDGARHPSGREGSARVKGAVEALTDSLLSRLSAEECELAEPLARFDTFPGRL